MPARPSPLYKAVAGKSIRMLGTAFVVKHFVDDVSLNERVVVLINVYVCCDLSKIT